MVFSWTTLAVGAAIVLVFLKPGYSIKQSYILTIAGVITAAVAFRFIYHCIFYPEHFSPLRQIPTPKNRSWFLGNLKSMTLDMELVRTWNREIPNDGLIRYYSPGNLEKVLVTGTNALNEILVSKVYDFEKSNALRISLLRYTGRGILLAEGEEHKTQRKGLLPSFSYRQIKNLYPIFWAKAVEMADAIERELPLSPLGTNVIRIGDWSQRVTLDVICLAGMGRDFGAIQNPQTEFQQRYQELRLKTDTFTKVLILIAMLTIGFKRVFQIPTKWNRRSQEAAAYIRKVSHDIIQEKREKLQEGIRDPDLASITLSSGVFTDDNMVDQMMTLLSAGHETISSSVQWAVYALCKYPDVQARLREEIRIRLPRTTASHGGKKPVPPSTAEIDSLPYLNAFANEVFRFHPPVISTVRQSRRDTCLSGSFIPKGTVLLITPGAINLDKKHWGPDAEEFNPDRWMGEARANSGGSDSNFANLTFLRGPRSCIGQSFAVLVGKFQMDLAEPNKRVEVIRSISQAPKDGVLTRLKRLEGW